MRMNAKRFFMLSLLIPCFIVASDDDHSGLLNSDDNTELNVTLSDDNSGGNDDVNLLNENISLENTHHEVDDNNDNNDNEALAIDKDSNNEIDLNPLEISHEEIKGEVREALEKLGVGTLAATALLNNSFGRIALVCFLGYKSFKNFKKAFQEKLDRHSHVTKGLSYLVAAGMMSQDGYAWLMSY